MLDVFRESGFPVQTHFAWDIIEVSFPTELTPDGLAVPPSDAPPQVQAVITAGNEIARLPYRFGGGHGTFIDTAYDCGALWEDQA